LDAVESFFSTRLTEAVSELPNDEMMLPEMVECSY
jgi:hypothetical protein